MVKSTFEIPERENRVLNTIKGMHGFRNREQALVFILKAFEENLEPELRPGYLKKLERIKKEKGEVFNKKEDFLNYLENEL